jgi:hypothetical protein
MQRTTYLLVGRVGAMTSKHVGLSNQFMKIQKHTLYDGSSEAPMEAPYGVLDNGLFGCYSYQLLKTNAFGSMLIKNIDLAQQTIATHIGKDRVVECPMLQPRGIDQTSEIPKEWAPSDQSSFNCRTRPNAEKTLRVSTSSQRF